MTSLAQHQAQRALQVPITPYVQPDHAFLSNLPADAAWNPPAEYLRQHVLPGAKRATTHTQLEAWLAEGLAEWDMVARINQEWTAANAQRAEKFGAWLDGPHRQAVERARDREVLRRVHRALESQRIEEQLGTE